MPNIMKRILLILSTLIAFVTTLQGQSLSVASFNELPNDLDARGNYPMTDQHTSKKYAILKVVTTETGFTFDIGMLSIGGTRQEVSEVWVYSPEGTKKIKIAHPQLGQLKTDDGYYWFPQPIQAACCYRM